MKSAGEILVISDRRDTLDFLSAILVAEGYNVRPAESVALALATVRASPPELILLDSRMPGKRGVCRELHALPESRDIPVLVLSDSHEVEDSLECLEAGAADFIKEPFQRKELLVRLATHLELARLRKSEAELRESQHRFRSIADGMPAGIAVFDGAGCLTDVGKWLRVFLGIAPEEFQGNGWFRSVHPDDVVRLQEEISAAVREQRSSYITHRLRRNDGEYRWVASTASPRFVNGEFAGHVVVLLDISDIKRSQEQALANQKFESLGVLAAGIAHEFNNRLSTVLAHSELALSDIPAEAPAHESVSTIATVALDAAEIVTQLMTYAGAADKGTPEVVDLTAVIQDMAKLLQVSVSRETALEWNLSAALPPIWINPVRIRDVVLVLVTNAFEALSGKPGLIRISTACAAVRKGATGAWPPDLSEGEYVVLEVSDTGCGMTEEIKTKIFDPFFSTKFIGRGLGLPSALGVVRAAGGGITLESSPGKGSTFQVWLPTADGLAASAEMETPQVAVRRPGRILLVDDEDGLRLAASSALQREGYSVIVAPDGTAALERIAEHSHEIGIAVLDMAMPGTSGQAVREALRQVKPDIPVLFTSALNPIDSRGKTGERFLQKPYRLKELVQAIRDIMPPVDRLSSDP